MMTKAPPRRGWNHNLHYHRLVLRAVPAGCDRVLDVGCGDGEFTRKLTRKSREVFGIDADGATIRRAREEGGLPANLSLIEDDALTYPIASESLDCITAIATLHHMDLTGALARFRELLRPGGVLAILGLYRPSTLQEYLMFMAALPISKAVRSVRQEKLVLAPMKDPELTLTEIRSTVSAELPGCLLRRLFFFRYFLKWKKPMARG